MKIEFFDKETGQSVRFQDDYVIDGHNDIYKIEFFDGAYEMTQAKNIGWRIVED